MFLTVVGLVPYQQRCASAAAMFVHVFAHVLLFPACSRCMGLGMPGRHQQ